MLTQRTHTHTHRNTRCVCCFARALRSHTARRSIQFKLAYLSECCVRARESRESRPYTHTDTHTHSHTHTQPPRGDQSAAAAVETLSWRFSTALVKLSADDTDGLHSVRVPSVFSVGPRFSHISCGCISPHTYTRAAREKKARTHARRHAQIHRRTHKERTYIQPFTFRAQCAHFEHRFNITQSSQW